MTLTPSIRSPVTAQIRVTELLIDEIQLAPEATRFVQRRDGAIGLPGVDVHAAQNSEHYKQALSHLASF